MDKPKNNPPGIADIAAAAGVSVATVSRVINESSKVREEAAAKVREAIETLGYTRIRKPKSTAGLGHYVGLAVPDIENPYFATLIRGVQSVAIAHGLDIVLMDSGMEPDHLRHKIIALSRKGMDTLLCVPAGDLGPTESQLASLTLPVVFMDRQPELPTANYVGSENRQGAYNAAKYLLSLGHRKILYLAGSGSLNTEKERRAGFLEALKESNVDPEQVETIVCDFSLEKAHEALRARLERAKDFTAVFAADDYMAYGALNAIREAGLRVPEDVSLVGFDDIPYSGMISLTTVSQPAFQIGANSMLLALDLLHGRKAAPQRIILPASLIIRGSCTVPRR